MGAALKGTGRQALAELDLGLMIWSDTVRSSVRLLVR